MEEQVRRKTTTTSSSRKNLKHTAARRVQRGRRKRRTLPFGLEPRTVLIAVVALVFLVIVIAGIKGCGISHKTPEGVAEAVLKAAVEGKAKKMKACYGTEQEVSSDLQSEIDTLIAYYKAHEAKELKVKACDTLFEEKNYAYVYVIYSLVLEDDQEYPAIKTMMAHKTEDGYYLLPASGITEELSSKAETAYTKFMTTDNYKSYQKAYDTFIKKNPGYETQLAERIG